MSKPIGKKKPWISIFVEMINSPAYLDLSGNAAKLLILMQIHWRMYEPIAYSVSEAQKRVGCSRGKAHEALRELESHGFIKLMLEGHFSKQLARKWRLTYREFSDQKPTNEWQNWKPVN
jgi:CTP-dependent riboflavin kinase